MTRLTDYAIILLTRIACAPEQEIFTASELAAGTRLPQPTVVKVLKRLGRADILSAQRGVKGGYRLVHPPGELSVTDIIAAFDGPIRIAECVETPPGLCDFETICPTKPIWSRINQAIVGALEQITLEEICSIAGRKEKEPPGMLV